MAEGAGLLNRCSVLGRYRGFESLSLRFNKKILFHAYASNRFFLFYHFQIGVNLTSDMLKHFISKKVRYIIKKNNLVIVIIL